MPRVLVVCLLASLLGGCAVQSASPPKPADPETVLVTYHVKPGDEAQFQDLLSQIWNLYTSNGLVLARPHVIVRGSEDNGKTKFVEILTWVSHDSPVQASQIPAISGAWATEQTLCEARGHVSPLEGGEVKLVTGGSQ